MLNMGVPWAQATGNITHRVPRSLSQLTVLMSYWVQRDCDVFAPSRWKYLANRSKIP